MVCPDFIAILRVILVALLLKLAGFAVLLMSASLSEADPSIFGCSHEPCDLGRGYDSRFCAEFDSSHLAVSVSASPFETCNNTPFPVKRELHASHRFVLLFLVKSQFLLNWQCVPERSHLINDLSICMSSINIRQYP